MPPAYADENSDLAALLNVTSQPGPSQTNVLDNVASVSTDETGTSSIDATVEGGQVVVPTDPSDGIDLRIPNSDSALSISLPFASRADDADVLTTGVVDYNNGNGTSTVPIVKNDGTLQIATIISSSSAPERYTYGVSTPQGATLESQSDGSVHIKNADDTLAGGIASPWARDSAGKDESTHYVLSGSTITQFVDLSDPGITYPVVADPAVSYVLLVGEWKNRPGGYGYKNGDQWSTHLSTWGAVVYAGGGATGQATLQLQGWKEWVNGPAPTSAPVEQQYRCHVAFGYAVWKAGIWWDFETARKSHSNWLTNPQDCNWA